MKNVLLILSLLWVQFDASGQQLLFSETLKQDGRQMNFEILGKCKDHYLVYKRITREHYLTSYDLQMKILGVEALDFIPERTFDVDFINYNDYLIAIYQYQKNNIVYCYGVRLDDRGKQLNPPQLLDTSRIGYFSDNRIYSTAWSENKKNILLYKRHSKNDLLTIATKTFDSSLLVKDSTHLTIEFNPRKEKLTDFIISNDGNIFYISMKQKFQDDFFESLTLHHHEVSTDGFEVVEIPLQGQYVDEPLLKYDNQNQQCLVTALYYQNKRGNVQGLYAVTRKAGAQVIPNGKFLHFSADLSNEISVNSRNRDIFDNLLPKNLILKKNGGFLLVLEDEYSETFYNNNWNRNYWGLPGNYSGDYYWYAPYYNSYRPWNDGRADVSKRFYNNDVVILSIDSTLTLDWNVLIPKKQYDVDNENFLSYGNVNAGSELHFLFIEKDNRHDIISNHAVATNGSINRYPTLKSFDNEYEFMPRLLKQVGLRKFLMPYAYMNRIGFVLINLN